MDPTTGAAVAVGGTDGGRACVSTPGGGPTVGRRRTWTDDDLITALDGATSWSQVKRRLGLSSSGGAGRVRRRCEELGLDLAHLPARGQAPRRWSDDDLRRAVAEASTLAGVFAALELSVGGRAWRRMQEHILRLGLDTSHWERHAGLLGAGRRDRIEIEDYLLRNLLPQVTTRAELARRLGLDPTNGSVQRRLRERIAELSLPTAHLRGRGWASGRSRPSRRRPIEELLVADSPHRGSAFRGRLVEEGILDPRCALCGLERWRGRPAPLQLDHVNGDPGDNRRENLRLRCPNCHAQTPTYCGRNIRNR